MLLISMPQGEAELVRKLALYTKFVMLQAGGEQAQTIPELLDEVYSFLAKTTMLDQVWPTRFAAMASILQVGLSAKVLSAEAIERLLGKTPSHLANFVRAHCAALTTSSDTAEDAYAALLDSTKGNRDAEAWFLVTLVEHGLGDQAMRIAEASSRSADLVPRLRRAWLCTHPESASTAISVADMAGDPIGEFLACGRIPDRVAYLRTATDGGRRSVPGAMWAGAGTEEEPEGLRGFWRSLLSTKKTADEVIQEYLTRNPLYSSYRRNTSRDRQFTEYVRMNGYGEYKYAYVDGALLQALVAWGDEDAAQVRSVVRAMWGAIQPDDQILMADFLRNAILMRCRNVFAAHPEALMQGFVAWFKRELVDKGRVWQSGRTQITLRFPNTSPLQFCVASAAGVNQLSPSRRDEILVDGMSRFPGDPATIEAAAQLYNSGKQLLDLSPPVGLKANLIEAWQLGIVKNAIPSILQAMAAQAQG